MKKILIFVLFVNTTMVSQKKNELPYYEITDSYKEYTAGTITARMLDGLGFRFYWATEGIVESNLVYKASEEGRTYEQTVKHILDLSRIIVNSALKQPNHRGVKYPELTYPEMRIQILHNIKKASDILKSETDLSDFDIIFKSSKGESRFPFWNNINGPIEDAVWHCGQLVALRRATGNPIHSKPSFFSGKVKN